MRSSLTPLASNGESPQLEQSSCQQKLTAEGLSFSFVINVRQFVRPTHGPQQASLSTSPKAHSHKTIVKRKSD